MDLFDQAITRNEYLKVLVVEPVSEEEPRNDINSHIKNEQLLIAKKLNVQEDRIIRENLTAKLFFERNMNITYFSKLSDAGDDDPFQEHKDTLITLLNSD